MYLFIDTTVGYTFGLLDHCFRWIEYSQRATSKGSSELHFEIFNMLEDNNLDIKNITKIIYAAGPGSYTGMRVSEGIKDIFELSGFDYCSFYHFDIPKFLNIKEGKWVSNAFKGEFFIHSWGADGERNELIPSSEVNQGEFYSNNFVEGLNIQLTTSLIFTNSKKIFKTIIDKDIKSKLFYYRKLEKEFKVQC